MKTTFIWLHIPLWETRTASSKLLDKPLRLSDTKMAPSEQRGLHLPSGCQAAPDWGSHLSPISCTGLPGQLTPKSTASPAKELELSSSSLQPGWGLGIINSIMQTARWTSMPNWGLLPLYQQGWPWKEHLRDGAGPAERLCPSLGFSGTPPSSSHPGMRLPVLS